MLSYIITTFFTIQEVILSFVEPSFCTLCFYFVFFHNDLFTICLQKISNRTINFPLPCDAGQVSATIKCPRFYPRHTVWYCDTRQTTATTKCILSYLCHAVRYRDTRQTTAVFKCTFSYLRNAVWYCDTRQTTAARKCIPSYLRHAVWYRDTRQTTAARKCIQRYMPPSYQLLP